MSADLVTLDAGIATTTSLKVAEGTDNEHRAVLQLIRNNIGDFAEFGRVAFEMRPFEQARDTAQAQLAHYNQKGW
jgi:phage regulator Rha-like protein